MSRMKKLVSMLLAMIMVLAMALPAMADEQDKSIKVTISEKSEGHVYTAYQIFAGDVVTEGDKKVFSNIRWGTGIPDDSKRAEFVSELKNTTVGANGEKPFAGITDAASIANVLSSQNTKDSALALAFAKVVAPYLTYAAATSNYVETAPEHYELSLTDCGYYMFKDGAAEGNTDTKDDVFSRLLLEVLDTTVEIAPKKEVPTIDKKIGQKDQDGTITSTGKDTNNAAIGDIIPFVVTSNVPDMTGYDSYTFKVHDTLSKGLKLSYQENDTSSKGVKIKIGNKVLETEEYTVVSTNNEDGTTTLDIEISDFYKNYKESGKDPIIITYQAELTEDAIVGTAGNDNQVKLEYSNDPEDTSKTGFTPDKKTYTYTTGIELKKFTKEGDEIVPLQNVEFELEGTSSLNTVVVKTVTYTQDDNGTYYKLKDGSYTTNEPNSDGTDNDQYADTKKKYKKVVAFSKEQNATDNKITKLVTTGSDGILRIDGLPAGEYTLREMKPLPGYNTIDPITFTITCTYPTNIEENSNCTWNIDNTNFKDNDSDGIYEILIENKKGSTLPSTGGAGTTLIYIIGGALIAGAGALLVFKKKREQN